MTSCEGIFSVKCLINGAQDSRMRIICTGRRRVHLRLSGIPKLKTARKMSKEHSKCGKTMQPLPNLEIKDARDLSGKLIQISLLKPFKSG